MKKILFIILAFSVSSAIAQNNMTILQYSIGFGSGDLGDYISKASFRGFAIDYRNLVQPNVGVGVDLGWNVFYDERPYDTYTIETLSYSGKQYRYTNVLPILLAADYYFQPGESINPFAGLGIGTMYSRRETDMGVFSIEQDGWLFALRPEIGILFEPEPGVGFKVSSKYYYGFEGGNLPEQGYFTLNFGFVLGY
jgi:outer membrane protein